MKFKGNIYQELLDLADSLDEHVTEDDIALKLRQLAQEVHPFEYGRNAFDKVRDENPGWYDKPPYDIAWMFWQAGSTGLPGAEATPPSRTEGLGFRIEQRGSTHVLVYDGDNGCHPASAAEVALWEAVNGDRVETPAMATDPNSIARAKNRDLILNRLAQFLYEEVDSRDNIALVAYNKPALVDAIAATLYRAGVTL